MTSNGDASATDDANKARRADLDAADEHDDAFSALKQHYAQHSIDFDEIVNADGGSAYFKTRYVRLNPRFCMDETLDMLTQELQKFRKSAPGNSTNDENSLQANNTHNTSDDTPALVDWLDRSWGFYAIPGDFPLSQSACYQQGRVYGQDISSGAAVAVLLSEQYDVHKAIPNESNHHGSPPNDGQKSSSDLHTRRSLRVLDLCCAPGAKLCAIADWLGINSSIGSYSSANDPDCHVNDKALVVGVDVSLSRLQLTKKVIHKYWIDSAISQQQDNHTLSPSSSDNVRIRLYHADGTQFGTSQSHELLFDSHVAMEQSKHAANRKRKRSNKSSRARERKLLKRLDDLNDPAAHTDDKKSEPQDGPTSMHLFDRVLVDAECSTDGSLRHIQQKWLDSNRDKTQSLSLPLLTDPDRLAELVALQKKLADAGYRLLAPGGVMVYSTCSLSVQQNEQVVTALLSSHEDAKLVPLELPSFISPPPPEGSVDDGERIAGTLRFVPSLDKAQDCDDHTEVNKSCAYTGGGFFIAKIRKQAVKSTLNDVNSSSN
jgi:16S rRNA C967 or C1407 C5-methylase (RsmB/RsmF family)